MMLHEQTNKPDSTHMSKDLIHIGFIFLTSVVALGLFLYGWVFADLDASDRHKLQFPTSLHAAQELGEVLIRYETQSPVRLMAGHAVCYLFLQTFAIPGTIFFNLLGGALFGLSRGFVLCLVYNTLGSWFLYQLSRQYGQRVILKQFPRKLRQLSDVIDGHRRELVLYMIFLRIFPFTPNWFINIASPHLKIPSKPFCIGIMVGLIPYNYLTCKAGLILSQLRSKQDIIDTNTTIQLIAVAIVGFIALPKLKKHFESPNSEPRPIRFSSQ